MMIDHVEEDAKAEESVKGEKKFHLESMVKAKKRFRSIPEEEQESSEEGENDDYGNSFRHGKRKPKPSYGKRYKMANDDDDDDDEDDEDQMPPEKMLWKLVKGKFLYTFKMCQKCNNRLFCDPGKFKFRSGHLQLTMLFCPKCVRLNIAATDVLEDVGKEQFKRRSRAEKGRKKKNGW